MNLSGKGLALIRKHEGLRLKAYRCPAGVLTIGYGHTGPDVKEGLEINQAKANCLLDSDVRFAVKKVNELVKKPINQNQFDALVSFTFNLGSGNLAKSTLLKKVNVDPGDKTISGEFAKWVNSGGKPLPGLIARRKEEAELYFT